MNSPAFSFDTLKPMAGRVLQDALNPLLKLDQASVEKLQALEGRRIECHRLCFLTPRSAFFHKIQADRRL